VSKEEIIDISDVDATNADPLAAEAEDDRQNIHTVDADGCPDAVLRYNPLSITERRVTTLMCCDHWNDVAKLLTPHENIIFADQGVPPSFKILINDTSVPADDTMAAEPSIHFSEPTPSLPNNLTFGCGDHFNTTLSFFYAPHFLRLTYGNLNQSHIGCSGRVITCSAEANPPANFTLVQYDPYGLGEEAKSNPKCTLDDIDKDFEDGDFDLSPNRPKVNIAQWVIDHHGKVECVATNAVGKTETFLYLPKTGYSFVGAIVVVAIVVCVLVAVIIRRLYLKSPPADLSSQGRYNLEHTARSQERNNFRQTTRGRETGIEATKLQESPQFLKV